MLTPRLDVVLKTPNNFKEYTIARFRSLSWMWGSRGKNYSKYMGYCSTFNADNSAITHRILTKKMCFERYCHGEYIVKTKKIDFV